MKHIETTTDAIILFNFVLLRQLVRTLYMNGRLDMNDIGIIKHLAKEECGKAPDNAMGMAAWQLIEDFLESEHFQDEAGIYRR